MKKYFVGVDLGTSNLKAITTDLAGNLLHRFSLPCSTFHPENNRAEQNPDKIFQQVIELLNNVANTYTIPPEAVSFSAAMHSLIAVDSNGVPLSNAIIWADNRAEKQTLDLKNNTIGKQIFLHTGTPIHTMSPLPKLIWLREEQPDTFNQTAWFCSQKEYIFYKIFGKKLVDMSIASATGLQNFETKTWFQPSLDIAHITEQQLSKIVSPYHSEILASNHLIPAWQNVPFVIGASDGTLANLGSGAIHDQQTTLTIGTSGAVRRTSSMPIQDGQMQLFNYILDEKHYIIGGPTNNGGITLQWLSENVLKQDITTTMQCLDAVEIGSEGLLFLPFILGERAPIWNAQAKGAFLNVSFNHTQAHFIRATLEGILFNLQNIHELVETQLSPTNIIYADGGFTKSATWVQMLADISGKEVVVRESEDSAAIGAIMIAMKSTGLYQNLEDITHILSATQSFKPNLENHRKYISHYENYKKAVKNMYPTA